jgi:hypothetical protein
MFHGSLKTGSPDDEDAFGGKAKTNMRSLILGEKHAGICCITTNANLWFSLKHGYSLPILCLSMWDVLEGPS